MEVSVSLLAAVIVIVVFNSVLDHLFSFLFRKFIEKDEDFIVPLLGIYIIKWIIVLWILDILLL